MTITSILFFSITRIDLTEYYLINSLIYYFHPDFANLTNHFRIIYYKSVPTDLPGLTSTNLSALADFISSPVNFSYLNISGPS